MTATKTLFISACILIVMSGCGLSISKEMKTELEITNLSSGAVVITTMRTHLESLKPGETRAIAFDCREIKIAFPDNCLSYKFKLEDFPEASSETAQPWFEAAFYWKAHLQIGENRKLYAASASNAQLSPQPEGFPLAGEAIPRLP